MTLVSSGLQILRSKTLCPRNFAELLYRLRQAVAASRSGCAFSPSEASCRGIYPRGGGDFSGGPVEPGVVSFVVPKGGRFYPCVVVREQKGVVSHLEFRRNGESLGMISSDYASRLPWRHTQYGTDPGREVLHYLEEAVEFEAGDSFEIASLGSELQWDLAEVLQKKAGGHSDKKSLPLANQGTLFHSLMLAETVPVVPPLRISNLKCVDLEGGASERGRRVMVAWTTNRPTRCEVTADSAVEMIVGDFSDYVNNHRVEFLVPGDVSRISGSIHAVEEANPEYECKAVEGMFVWEAPSSLPSGGGFNNLQFTVGAEALAQSTPLTGGIPFAPGALFDADCLGLADASDTPMPLQTRVLSRWPSDRSVQWLLVDSVVGSAAPTSFILADQQRKEGGERDGIEWARHGPTIRVRTGETEFSVGGEGLVVEGPQGRGHFELVDAEGACFDTLSGLDSLEVEDAGSLRLCVCLRGTFRLDGESKQGYQCRVHFFAGSRRVKFEFTFECRDFGKQHEPVPKVATNIGFEFSVPDPEDEMCALREIRFRMVPHCEFEAICSEEESVFLETGSSLLQLEENRAEMAGRAIADARGWCFVRGVDGPPFAIIVPKWRELYPKGFCRLDNALLLQIVPELPVDTYAGMDEETRVKLCFWHREGLTVLRRGVQFTTEFLIEAVNAPEECDGLCTAWEKPLRPLCSVEHYCESGAFGPLRPAGSEPLSFFGDTQRTIFENHLESRERGREFGFLNFGDWHGERVYNWGNCEYDTVHAFLTSFAGIGDVRMLEVAIDAAKHNVDVDVRHISEDQDFVNTPYEHAIGHTGGYVSPDWKDLDLFSTNGKSGDRGHTWVGGTFAAYGFTGCERLLETANGVAETLASTVNDFTYYNERNAAWPMIALGFAEDFNGSPFLRNASRLIRDQLLWTQHPTRGLWGARLNPSECLAPGPWCACWGGKPFMTAILLTALHRNLLRDPDQQVEKSFLRCVDYLWRETFVESLGKFDYSQCQSYANHRYSSLDLKAFFLGGAALLWAQRISPSEKAARCLPIAIAGFSEEAHALAKADAKQLGKLFGQYQVLLPALAAELEAFGIANIDDYISKCS